jgi:hypothetical protein
MVSRLNHSTPLHTRTERLQPLSNIQPRGTHATIDIHRLVVYTPETHLAYAQEQPMMHVLSGLLTDMDLQDYSTARVLISIDPAGPSPIAP